MDKLLLYVSKNDKKLYKKTDGVTIYNAVIMPETKEAGENIFKGDNEYILQQVIENNLLFDEIIIENYEDISTENNNYTYAYIKCLNNTGIFTVNNLSSADFVQYSNLYTLKEDGQNIVIKDLQKEETSKSIEVINFSYKYKVLADKPCMDIRDLILELQKQKAYINELEEQCINFNKWYKDLEKGAKSTYEELQKSQAYIKDLENICKTNEEIKLQQQSYIKELENICKNNEEYKHQQHNYIKELEDSVKNVYNQLDEKSKYITELENTCKEQEQVIQDKDEYFSKMKETHENEITQLIDENIRKIETTNKIHEDAVKKLLKIENSIWYKVFNKFYKY